MPKSTVEAVWCFPPTQSNYRAVQGRVTGTPSRKLYTKDYLQVGGEAGRLLGEVFGLEPGESARADVKYAWPGGESDGMVAYSADRFHFAWPYNGVPFPFGFQDGQAAPGRPRLPGFSLSRILEQRAWDEASENESDARQRLGDDQWADLRAQGFNPWWVFVRLHDDGDRVHLRLYLDDPPHGYEELSAARLPAIILEKMREALPPGGYQTARAGKPVALRFDRDGEALLESRLARQVWGALQDNRNVLLSGPPGTGKTVALEQVARFFSSDQLVVHFDPEAVDSWSEDRESRYRSVSRAVVFHPSYGYEDFVLGVLPEPTKTGVGVRVRPGPLLSLAHFASIPDRRALLTLDEFNRGNAAAIFGDTLALLDTDKRADPAKPGSGARIDRGYPGLNVEVSGAFTTSTNPESLGDVITLPHKLYLLAAMNSSDRSVAPLDAAMRRRFAIIFVGPDYDVLAEHLGAAEALPAPDGQGKLAAWDKHFDTWGTDDVAALAVDVLRGLNERIEFVSGQDFTLGQAQFWQACGDSRDDMLQSVCESFDRNVVGTLRLAYLDHDEALAAVLGLTDDQSQSRLAHWVSPPSSLKELAGPRLVIAPLAEMSPVHQAEALRGLC